MKNIILSAALFAAVAAPAFARDMSGKADGKAKYYFNQIDTNKDGMVSKEEHTAFSDKMFMEADTNQDGNISMDEMRAAKQKEMEKHASMKGANVDPTKGTKTGTQTGSDRR